MKDFNDLDGKGLAEIINRRETEVINTSQDITNTIAIATGKWFEFSIPLISLDKDLAQIYTATILNGTDKKTVWNSFILLAYNVGANIKYRNLNNVDCQVEISF